LRNSSPIATAAHAAWPRLSAGSASGGVALSIAAATFAVMFFGVTLPSPLYPLYQRAFGFGGVTLTLVYAVYVVGNLTALLFFGRLSDQIGRRAVALPAVGVGIASTLAFLVADATVWLFVARALSGLATGLAAGAVTAWIAELEPRGDKGTASVIAAAANFFGCSAAPLLAGGLAVVAPHEALRLPFAAYVVLLAATGLALLWPRDTVTAPVRSVSDVSLRPRIGVPLETRAMFVAPAVTAFATFALIGFYSALIPSLLGQSLHEKSPLVAGAIVGELFLVSAAAIVATRRWPSRTAMLAGLALLFPSLALLVAAELARALPLLAGATALAGLAGALGYRGSLELVNRIAPDDRRAELVSSYQIAMYLGNSLPVIGIGLLSERAGSSTAHETFAAVIGLLAAGAVGAALRFRPQQRAPDARSGAP
jgi:MFS family permease